MCSLLIGAIALAFGNARQFRTTDEPAARLALAVRRLSTAGFIAALAHMHLANISAVLQIAPLIITALSVVLYREVVGWRRWTAIGIGFAGALLVVKPIPSEFNIWAAGRRCLRRWPPPCVKSRTARSGEARRCSWSHSGAPSASRCAARLFILIEDWRMFRPVDLFQLFVAAVLRRHRHLSPGARLPRRRPLGGRAVSVHLSADLRDRRLSGVPRGAGRLDRGRALS